MKVKFSTYDCVIFFKKTNKKTLVKTGRFTFLESDWPIHVKTDWSVIRLSDATNDLMGSHWSVTTISKVWVNSGWTGTICTNPETSDWLVSPILI